MTKSTAVALFGDKETMPAHVASGHGLGNENVGKDDVAMPYLNVLQALSPQIESLEGAKAGQLHNSITNELYDAVYVLNLFYSREFAVFKKRDLGGGFEGAYTTDEEARAHIRDNLDGKFSDFDVVETARHICLLLDDSGKAIQPVILNLSGTKVRVSKAWNAEISVKCGGADRFAAVWKLATVRQKNTKGSWHNLSVEFAGWAPEPLYNEAKEYYKAVAPKMAA